MAICFFHNGYTAIQRIASRLKIYSGQNLTIFLSRLDTDQVKGAERKASQPEKCGRKKKDNKIRHRREKLVFLEDFNTCNCILVIFSLYRFFNMMISKRM